MTAKADVRQRAFDLDAISHCLPAGDSGTLDVGCHAIRMSPCGLPPKDGAMQSSCVYHSQMVFDSTHLVASLALRALFEPRSWSIGKRYRSSPGMRSWIPSNRPRSVRTCHNGRPNMVNLQKDAQCVPKARSARKHSASLSRFANPEDLGLHLDRRADDHPPSGTL